MKIIVAQLGARRDYVVPQILDKEGMLEHFYTDICAIKGWLHLLKYLPNTLRSDSLKRLLGRIPDGIPPKKITAFTSLGWEYYRRRIQAKTHSDLTAADLWSAKEFCNLILKKGFGRATTVYTFNSAGLELLQTAKAQGLRTIMEQTIAPLWIEHQLLCQEQQAFPDWESPLLDNVFSERFSQKEQTEWSFSDVIFCGSEFVRESVAACGGPTERCVIVPYGVGVRFSWMERLWHKGPLRVLTVGTIGLRKGSPYVLEAAKRLQGKAEFRMVGPVHVLPQAESRLRSCIKLTGPVPRTEILSHYAWADVFLLPSICEGSASVVYEALATGLPVICTPNTGSVVRDGVDGFIVPIRDPEAICAKLEQLAKDRELCMYLSSNARQRAAEFTMAEYGCRLVSALNSISTPVSQ